MFCEVKLRFLSVESGVFAQNDITYEQIVQTGVDANKTLPNLKKTKCLRAKFTDMLKAMCSKLIWIQFD